MPKDSHNPRASANKVGRDYLHRANKDGHTPTIATCLWVSTLNPNNTGADMFLHLNSSRNGALRVCFPELIPAVSENSILV